MFSPGLKFVTKDRREYVVMTDAMLTPEPNTVQVFENGDYASKPRKEIFDDIIAGAYIAGTVHYHTKSKQELQNAFDIAAIDKFMFWYERYQKETEPCWKSLCFESLEQDVLVEAHRSLHLDREDGYDVGEMTIFVNNCWYPVEKMILLALQKAYRYHTRGEKNVV